jgi:hypothetical protein
LTPALKKIIWQWSLWWPPGYSRNIVESGDQHHNHNLLIQNSIFRTWCNLMGPHHIPSKNLLWEGSCFIYVFLCLLAYSGIQHIYCVVFLVLLVFVL